MGPLVACGAPDSSTAEATERALAGHRHRQVDALPRSPGEHAEQGGAGMAGGNVVQVVSGEVTHHRFWPIRSTVNPSQATSYSLPAGRRRRALCRRGCARRGPPRGDPQRLRRGQDPPAPPRRCRRTRRLPRSAHTIWALRRTCGPNTRSPAGSSSPPERLPDRPSRTAYSDIRHVSPSDPRRPQLGVASTCNDESRGCRTPPPSVTITRLARRAVTSAPLPSPAPGFDRASAVASSRTT